MPQSGTGQFSRPPYTELDATARPTGSLRSAATKDRPQHKPDEPDPSPRRKPSTFVENLVGRALMVLEYDALLQVSKRLARWAKSHRTTYPEWKFGVPPSRLQVVVGCLSITQEIQRSVVYLMSRGMHESASSLLRVVSESYIRGLWLNYCATEKELDRYVENKGIARSMEQMVEAVALKEPSEGSMRDRLDLNLLVSLTNSLTHCGPYALALHNLQRSGFPVEAYAVLTTNLHLVNSFCLFAGVRMGRIMGDENITRAYGRKMIWYLRVSGHQVEFVSEHIATDSVYR